MYDMGNLSHDAVDTLKGNVASHAHVKIDSSQSHSIFRWAMFWGYVGSVFFLVMLHWAIWLVCMLGHLDAARGSETSLCGGNVGSILDHLKVLLHLVLGHLAGMIGLCWAIQTPQGVMLGSYWIIWRFRWAFVGLWRDQIRNTYYHPDNK